MIKDIRNRLLPEAQGFDRNSCFLVSASSGDAVSRSEFACYAASLSLSLMEVSKPGDRVGLLMDNGIPLAASYWACMASGRVAVPLNLTAQEDWNIKILSTARVSLVLTDRNITLGNIKIHKVNGLKPSSCGLESILASNPMPSTAPCLLVFTSGSEGRPKGVFHSPASLLSNAAAFCDASGLQSSNRLLHILPMYYMAGFLNNLLCPYVAGSSVVLERIFDARMALSFWETPSLFQADAMWLSPSIISAVVKLFRGGKGTEYAINNVKHVFSATAPLPDVLREALNEKFHLRVRQSYGLSETLITTLETEEDAGTPSSSGVPLHGIELMLGTNGEVLVRSEHSFAGYLDYESGEPAYSLDSEGYFHTGDIGAIENGRLRITSRLKDIIITGGVNVSPAQVEQVLIEHSDVKHAAVIGIPHDVLGEEVVAVVSLFEGSDAESVLKDLSAICKNKLLKEHIPKKFHVMLQMPCSPTGKVLKPEVFKLITNKEV